MANYELWNSGTEYESIWYGGDEYIEAWTLIDGVKTLVWAKTSTPTQAGLYDEDWNLIVSWEDSDIENNCSNARTIISDKYPNTRHVVISNSTKLIYTAAFYNCANLISVYIPNSVVEIGRNAFRSCSSLTTINIPNSVKNLNGGTFMDCHNLTSAILPEENLLDIGDSIFENCYKLTSINIPKTIRIIYAYAFSLCYELSSITIPDSVTTIKSNAFYKVPHIEYHGAATGAPWGALSMN